MLLRLLCLSALALPWSTGPVPPAPAALAVIDTAISRMGGMEPLSQLQQVRREMLTQWLRVNFDDRPFSDAPSYERHSDVRDYALPGWRNTRTFMGGGPAVSIVDIVRDSVGVREFNGTWQPLNVAYVDERQELFTFAPERVLLLARTAGDLRLGTDTTVAGVRHARVSATIAGFSTTLLLRRGDGLLAAAFFRAGHPNDFGLAPWGVMPVEIWYSRWQRYTQGLVLPTQWDTRRVGRPYKRITVLATTFDSVAAADSFIVSDSLRERFNTTSRRPMHDLPLDSARVLEGRVAAFKTNGAPAGAVRLGSQWWLLESGQAPFNAERAAAWLEHQAPGSRVAGALITAPGSSNGGIAWLTAQQRIIRATNPFTPIGRTILQDHHQPPGAIALVTQGQWIRAGGDSLWIEPIDFPDLPGAMYVYVPSLKWAYSGVAASPLQYMYLTTRLRERGFETDYLGSFRSVWIPTPK